MKYFLHIPRGDRWYFFDLLSYSNFDRIVVPDVVVINVRKYHDHRYDFEAFFYGTKFIYSWSSFRSKRELYGAIQKALQENLNVDVQKVLVL